MTDTSDRQPVEGAEILKLLREIEAQSRVNGEALTDLGRRVADIRGELDTLTKELRRGNQSVDLSLKLLTERVNKVSAVVDRAAPLLDSAPARAMAGGGVLGMLRGNPRRHG